MDEDIVVRLKDGREIRKNRCVKFRIEADRVFVQQTPLDTGRPYFKDEIANWTEVSPAAERA